MVAVSMVFGHCLWFVDGSSKHGVRSCLWFVDGTVSYHQELLPSTNQRQWPNTMLTATINEPETVTEHHAYCYHQWTRVSDGTPCLLLTWFVGHQADAVTEHHLTATIKNQSQWPNTMLTATIRAWTISQWPNTMLTATINEPESVTEHHDYCTIIEPESVTEHHGVLLTDLVHWSVSNTWTLSSVMEHHAYCYHQWTRVSDNEPEFSEHHAYCYHQWTRVSDRTPCLLLPSTNQSSVINELTRW